MTECWWHTFGPMLTVWARIRQTYFQNASRMIYAEGIVRGLQWRTK